MKIALIGYGKMGHIIEDIALKRGHEVVARIDIDNQADMEGEAFRSADVAIEFTTPKTALGNISRTLAAGVPIVVGTTGWYDHLEDVKAEVAAGNGKLFYATNFSVGVNIFQAVNRYLAKIMNGFADYDVTMEETHHIHKLDSPSGTAITLANTILGELDRKNAWMETAQVPEGKTLADVEARSPKDDELAITAYRRGEVPGIHTVIWDSAVDTITLTHSAKSRAGFALGAVLAAEFLPGQKAGVYNMSDLMPF